MSPWWREDDNGNLVAEKGDNAYTLADYLGTSPEIAKAILAVQGHSVNEKGILDLNVNDVLEVEHTTEAPEERDDLGYVGNNIRKRASSEFSKDMFENYWNGDGDIELTGERFMGVLLYVKDNDLKMSDLESTSFTDSDGDEGKGTQRVASFYNSVEYKDTFGSATLNYTSKARIIGIYDKYDFNKQPWGQRSTISEITTRAIKTFSPKKAKNFEIRYGYSTR